MVKWLATGMEAETTSEDIYSPTSESTICVYVDSKSVWCQNNKRINKEALVTILYNRYLGKVTRASLRRKTKVVLMHEAGLA